MAVSDAQFVFETNLPQVRKDIETELAQIANAVNKMQGGTAGGDLLSGLTGKIKRDVASAVEQIRQVQEQARQQVASKTGLQSGQQTAALQINDVLAMLYGKVEDRLRQAAIKAGPEAANVDLKGIFRELDEALFAHVRNQSRAMIREVERAGTSQEQQVFGTSKQIPSRRGQTDLTTVGDLKQQIQDSKDAAKNITASQRRLQKATDDNAEANEQQGRETRRDANQRRGGRQRLAKSETDLAAANEEATAATRGQTKQTKQPRVVQLSPEAIQRAESNRVAKGIGSGDPNFAYATRSGNPGTRVVDRTDPDNLRYFKESSKGFEEIPKTAGEYTRLQNAYNLQLEDRRKKDAEAAAAQAKADADLLKSKQAYNRKIQAALAGQNPDYGYITKSGNQGKFVYDDPDGLNPRISKNTGTNEEPFFEEVDQSTKEYAYQQRRLQGILGDRAQAEQEAARQAAALAATQAEAKAALSQQIRDSLMARNGQYDYISKNGAPTKDVYTGTSRDALTVYRQDANGGFDEITPAHKDYVAAVRRAQDSFDREARGTQDATAADKAASEALAAAKVAAAKSADITAKLAAGDRSVQYLTDSGRPTGRVAVGENGEAPAAGSASYFQQQGGGYAEIPRLNPDGEADARFVSAENLLTAQLNDRRTDEERSTQASKAYAETLRKSSASAVGVAGGGGFGGGFSSGVFSGGFGDSGDTPAFGIGRSLGQTVKYSLAYKVFNDLLMVLNQVSQEFLNVDDSYVELQYAMASGSDVTTSFVNSLQDIAAPGGFNVGDAMDQAAASIRAYRDEILAADGDTQKLLENDIGTNFTKAAAQVAVIAKTTLADAAQNNRATALGFGLEPTTGAGRIADAISNAKLSGGGIEKDISQGGASIAEIAHAAGFSLEESLNVVSKLSAKLDESGQLAATRFSRMVGTLQGSAGKNFLTQLNQSLPTGQQIDISASPRDQVLQIAAAYDTLNEAQKQQLSSAIGGTAQQREFNVLIQSFPQLAKDAANSQVGLADQEYQDRLNNVRGLLTQIRGELIGIVTNVSKSGLLDGFGLVLKVLEPILAAVRDITKSFNLIPSAIREIGLGLLGVYATMRAITSLRNAGGGSIVEGVKAKLQGAERVAFPAQAEARERMNLTGNHDEDFQRVVVAPAEEARQARRTEINQQEREGTLTAGAASTARRQADADFNQAIRANTADYKRAAKEGANVVQEGGNEVRASFRRLRGDEMGNNLRSLRDSIVRGQVAVEGAFTGAGGAIKSGAKGLFAAPFGEGKRVYGDLRTPQLVTLGGAGEAGGATRLQTSRLSAAAEAVRTSSTVAGAGLRRVGEAAVEAAAALNASRVGRGVEAASAALGRGVGGAVRGIGSAVASEFGPIGIGLIAADLGLQLKESFDQISEADRTLAAAASIDVNQGAQALSDAAKANEEAAKQMREAAGGFFGTIANFLQGGAPGASADRADELAGQQQGLANRLQAQQQAATTGVGPAALAAQIDTSSGDEVKASIQNLLDAGQSASDVLDAVTIALKSLKFAATGAVGELTGLQQTDLAGRLGIGAGRTVGYLKTQLSDTRDRQGRAQTDDEYQGLDRQANGLAQQLDALGPNGSNFLTNRVSDITDRFFKSNPAANLNDPKVQQKLQTQIQQELTAKYGVRADTAFTASGLALAVLPGERDKQLTQLADPQTAGALVQGAINAAGLAGDTVTQNAKLQSLRTGGPDHSATAGLKVQHQGLQELQSTIQDDITAMDAAGKDSAQLRLQLGVVQNALVSTEVKQAEQLAADAKSDIDDIEKRRKARQAASTSVAQVKAIGDAAIKDELGKAIKTMDPDLLASVIERASDEELDNFKKFLEQKLATDQMLIEKEKELEIAAGLLNPDGTSTQLPSPLIPGSKNPQSTLPDFLRNKKLLPKPLQDLLNQQGSDQAAYDLYLKITGQTVNNGAAATGSDVPGGTPDEKKAAAAAASAERNRNSTQAAAAKVAAAKAARDKITNKGSVEYHQAEEQYYAALNAQADLAQDTAISQAKAALYPGDKVGAAKVAVDDATNNVKRFAKGSKEYWDAVGKLAQAQVDYAAAQREQANLIAQTHIDLSDPVAVANQALKDARRKLADDRKNPKVDKGTIAADQIDVANKAAAADNAAFQQRLSDAQTADQLGRTSHATYIRYLQSEHNRLTERLAGMKKGDQAYRQALDQLNEIDKDMKEASNQLTGQFNLGDIKIPSVYEVRRSLQAQAAGLSANAISTTAVANTTTNNVTVNGADFARVTAWLQQIFGKTARITTTPRKA